MAFRKPYQKVPSFGCLQKAVAAVLSHYAGYIRSCAKMDGQINTDMQEHIVGRLIESLLKFRFDR